MESTCPQLIPVILSGGSGSRLWPVSRKLHPKPFMRLPDGETLMGKTFRRASELPNVQEILTVTNRDLYFRTRDEFAALALGALTQRYLLEPCGRNTAPAIAAAARHIAHHHGPDACMLVMPADHLITDQQAFCQAVNLATGLAHQKKLVTFGIRPTHPETGYGYIHAETGGNDTASSYPVSRFVEKPDSASAERYLASGDYYWNAGIFCFTAGTILEQLMEHAPELLLVVDDSLTEGHSSEGGSIEQLELAAESFAKAQNISIDYAVLERSDQVAVVPCDIGWSDIGSWTALSELLPTDDHGNHLHGEVVALDTRNTTIHSPGILTATVGVQDLIIVHTTDAVMVAHRDAAQNVKGIVDELARTGHEAHLIHRTVHRPWGTYTTLEEGERFKIKRIVVKPGHSLSLQMHHHRSEHWVVVSGMARVVNETSECLLGPNESTFIPAGHKHRLDNPGVIDLVLIEVQSGDYLGENDIQRYDDAYGRS